MVDQPVDAMEKVLGELPMPWVVTVEDVRLAIRAVLVHAPEEWPTGPLCRSDRTPHPCLLHRWGRRVLRSRGLPDDVIDDLRGRGELLVRVPDGGC
ncbi:hypothetical protein [Micromonospora sp. CB01531]|uniref:hypothetical protein n=1 Tax=Micromonospora sp. CB01531 TaxID=1718947 RepID=UPI001F517F1E|nr:hypothetical protein [Micromonospora sp. CB01531]